MVEAVGGRVEAVTVVDRLADVATAQSMLSRGIDETGSSPDRGSLSRCGHWRESSMAASNGRSDVEYDDRSSA
jgi:hypothetical protein